MSRLLSHLACLKTFCSRAVTPPTHPGSQSQTAGQGVDRRPPKERRTPTLTSSVAAIIPHVSQPEIQLQVRQQRADIDALYELVERVDQKLDALDVKLDRRFDEIGGQISEMLRQLGGQ